MPRKKREYKSEYARRIARAQERGLSRSQARGHARASEEHLRPPRLTLSDERVQAALRSLRQDASISAAARTIKVSPERMRKFALDRDLIEKSGRRWRLKPTLPRRMPLFSKGRAVTIVVASAEEASAVGRFMSAVGHFLETNKSSLLSAYEGGSVRDATSKSHPFETRPNTLYRLAASGGGSFEQIYRIVI